MGKALIVSGGEGGLYTVKPLHSRDRIDAEIARLEGVLQVINEELIAAEVKVLDAQVVQADAIAELDWIIEQAALLGEIPDPTLVRNATAAALKARAAVALAVTDKTLIDARRLTAQAELRALGSIPIDQDQQAWCADLVAVQGEVATAEIPGEGKTNLIIRPGYEGRAEYNPVRDGQLFHRAGQSPAQVYFNAAILPGWQKFKPTYRVGVIAGIDYDAHTGTVTLDETESSAQQLPINQAQTLSNVPIEYMDCNSGAFENGDRVLVEFVGQNWGSPKVIGFESNPRECEVDWPAEVQLPVKIETSEFSFTAPLRFVTEVGARKVLDVFQCCGMTFSATEEVRQRSRTLYCGGADGVWFTFEAGYGMFPENTDFELVEAEAFEDKVEIDRLFENGYPGNTGGLVTRSYPSYSDERGEEGDLAHCRISAAVGWTEAPRTLWTRTKATGYGTMSLPPTNDCDADPVSYLAGRREGNLENGTVTIASPNAVEAGCVNLIPILDFEEVRYLGRGATGQANALFSDVAEFARDKDAIPDTLTVRRKNTEQTQIYFVSGTVGGNSWENIRYVREDLIPEE